MFETLLRQYTGKRDYLALQKLHPIHTKPELSAPTQKTTTAYVSTG
jgi:hypothetical protein